MARPVTGIRISTVTTGVGFVGVGGAVIPGTHAARKRANIVARTRNLLINMGGSFRNIARSDNDVIQSIVPQPV
jgi:hypothetical protein